MDRNDRFRWAVRPLAEKENMVQGTRFRFTVLTSRLIRLEYSPGGCFEDRASQSVFYRDLPPVPFTIDGWVGVREENTVDTYFFGYGFDYVAAVRDFYSLTGVPPMLPAYALGNWWSRYHAYTQEEYLALIHRFREEDIPFSVGVVDMDWHLVDIDVPSPLPNDLPGWTGYTWHELSHPYPAAALGAAHVLQPSQMSGGL